MSSDCPSLFFFLSPASDCVSPTLSAWWSGVLLPSKGARRPRFVHGSVLRVWQNYETLHYGGFIQYISLQSERNTHPSRKVMASKVPLVSEAPPALLRWGWERVRRTNVRDLIRQITLCLDVQAGTQRDMTVNRRVSSRQVSAGQTCAEWCHETEVWAAFISGNTCHLMQIINAVFFYLAPLKEIKYMC